MKASGSVAETAEADVAVFLDLQTAVLLVASLPVYSLTVAVVYLKVDADFCVAAGLVFQRLSA
jgi:hypothetical protein